MASKTARAAKSATEALKILWEECFFVGWKKKAPIEAVLSKRGNHFSDAELGMALKRAKHLTRKGKRGNYEYIQKYPYTVAAKQNAAKDEKPHARKR
ncbi:MAG: hypothetical protein ACREBC_12490 [Pyrinomonadaceae bacterium]